MPLTKFADKFGQRTHDYFCLFCPYTSPGCEDISTHLRKHIQFGYVCLLCRQLTIGLNEFRDHTIKCHGKPMPLAIYDEGQYQRAFNWIQQFLYSQYRLVNQSFDGDDETLVVNDFQQPSTWLPEPSTSLPPLSTSSSYPPSTASSPSSSPPTTITTGSESPSRLPSSLSSSQSIASAIKESPFTVDAGSSSGCKQSTVDLVHCPVCQRANSLTNTVNHGFNSWVKFERHFWKHCCREKVECPLCDEEVYHQDKLKHLNQHHFLDNKQAVKHSFYDLVHQESYEILLTLLDKCRQQYETNLYITSNVIRDISVKVGRLDKWTLAKYGVYDQINDALIVTKWFDKFGSSSGKSFYKVNCKPVVEIHVEQYNDQPSHQTDDQSNDQPNDQSNDKANDQSSDQSNDQSNVQLDDGQRIHESENIMELPCKLVKVSGDDGQQANDNYHDARDTTDGDNQSLCKFVSQDEKDGDDMMLTKEKANGDNDNDGDDEDGDDDYFDCEEVIIRANNSSSNMINADLFEPTWVDTASRANLIAGCPAVIEDHDYCCKPIWFKPSSLESFTPQSSNKVDEVEDNDDELYTGEDILFSTSRTSPKAMSFQDEHLSDLDSLPSDFSHHVSSSVAESPRLEDIEPTITSPLLFQGYQRMEKERSEITLDRQYETQETQDKAGFDSDSTDTSDELFTLNDFSSSSSSSSLDSCIPEPSNLLDDEPYITEPVLKAPAPAPATRKRTFSMASTCSTTEQRSTVFQASSSGQVIRRKLSLYNERDTMPNPYHAKASRCAPDADGVLPPRTAKLNANTRIKMCAPQLEESPTKAFEMVTRNKVQGLRRFEKLFPYLNRQSSPQKVETIRNPFVSYRQDKVPVDELTQMYFRVMNDLGSCSKEDEKEESSPTEIEDDLIREVMSQEPNNDEGFAENKFYNLIDSLGSNI